MVAVSTCATSLSALAKNRDRGSKLVERVFEPDHEKQQGQHKN